MRRPRKNVRYCSLACYRSSPERPFLKTGDDVACGACGKVFYARKSQLDRTRFCSVDCANIHQSRNKSRHLCKICGCEFFWSPSRVRSQNPTYCSISCRNKCTVWKANAVIAGNVKQQIMKGPNRLEVAGSEILNELGIEHKTQVLLAGRFMVDVLIEDRKLVIQWDGDYWHGYRQRRDLRPLSKHQVQRKNLDRSQDAYLRKAGFSVLRVWEHDVLKNRESVVRRIIAAATENKVDEPEKKA